MANQDLSDTDLLGRVYLFAKESNAIEGILRCPTDEEVHAHVRVLGLKRMTLEELNRFQSIVAPGKPLRTEAEMNVQVGSHIAPQGGPYIVQELAHLIEMANMRGNPWRIHYDFETLHPYMDGNGRTGRALWMWHMRRLGKDPFLRSFLHTWYYQTLEEGL